MSAWLLGIRNEAIPQSDGTLNEQIIGGGALSSELWDPTDQLGVVSSSHSSQRWPRAVGNVPWQQLSALFPPWKALSLDEVWWVMRRQLLLKSCLETLTWHSEC